MIKSRFTKENKDVEVKLNYDTGLDRYYGLLDLAEKYEFGGKVKGKKNKGNVCRGGGAALRGTKFSGTK